MITRNFKIQNLKGILKEYQRYQIILKTLKDLKIISRKIQTRDFTKFKGLKNFKVF